MKTPILFLSDAVSSSSGLGRITRDLATRLHEHCSDVFDLANRYFLAKWGGREEKDRWKVPFNRPDLFGVGQ